MLQLPVLLESVHINKDRSVTIKLETRELSTNQIAEISGYAQEQECWIGMDKSPITKLDIPDEIAEFDNEKTPSQRLRNVLFVYWKEVMKSKGDFEEFRKGYMEKIINNIKEKLPSK